MKALSLRQPWAELILQGRKTIETRKWNTSFRGAFLIHASRQVDSLAMRQFGFRLLPAGCIVGRAELIGVKEYTTRQSWDADADRHLARSLWDGKKRFGFILKGGRRVAQKPARGKLGFFDVRW